jgi:hypothetical protein
MVDTMTTLLMGRLLEISYRTAGVSVFSFTFSNVLLSEATIGVLWSYREGYVLIGNHMEFAYWTMTRL